MDAAYPRAAEGLALAPGQHDVRGAAKASDLYAVRVKRAASVVIVWTDYMKHRAELRGFDLSRIEHIVRFGQERYRDTATGRAVAVGRHGTSLVVVPFEQDGESITPVTVHATSRQQVEFRVKSGRFSRE